MKTYPNLGTSGPAAVHGASAGVMMHQDAHKGSLYSPLIAIPLLSRARTALWILTISFTLLATTSSIIMAQPVDVAGSQSLAAMAQTYQRKLFRDDSGYFWAFYFDGTDTYCKRSDDTTGSSWTGASQLFSAGDVQPSVWLDADTVYVAFASGGDILVRTGTLSGGSINWSAPVIAIDGDATASYLRATICEDENGFIWVSAQREAAGDYYACAARSVVPYSTASWQAPEIISPLSSTDSVHAVILPLKDGDVYAVWSREGIIEGKRYSSGTGWEATETSIDAGVQGDEQMLFSAVSDKEGRVHLLYVSQTEAVCYRRYDGASWSSEQVLSAGPASCPAISINPSNQRLYALWIEDRRTQCRSAVLPSSSTDWKTETPTPGKAPKGSLTACYSSSSRINWLYCQGKKAPYSVRTDGIAVARVSVMTSKSSFAFGTQPLNTWLVAESTLVVNDGTCPENVYAQLSQFASGAFTWAISAASNGPDLCRAQWSDVSDAGPWSDIPAYDTEFLIATNLAAGASIPLYFRIQTPTLTSSYNEYSSGLTVRAEDY